MAEKQEYFWELPPLAPEDQKLRDAYARVGRPLDQLPYTEAFDRLVAMIGRGKTRWKNATTFSNASFI